MTQGRRPNRPRRRRSPTFERFTERARHVVVLAQSEAGSLGHDYIGTEHILLGLLREEEGLAARVLESRDLTVEEVRAQVADLVGRREPITQRQIPFTPHAKKVLELALREALSLGHNYIGTEHILLGLVRENDGVAARVLENFDVDAASLREQLIGMLGGPQPSVAGRLRKLRRRELVWEYRVVPLEPAQELSAELLNPLGEEGWELAAAVHEGEALRLVLKRPRRA